MVSAFPPMGTQTAAPRCGFPQPCRRAQIPTHRGYERGEPRCPVTPWIHVDQSLIFRVLPLSAFQIVAETLSVPARVRTPGEIASIRVRSLSLWPVYWRDYGDPESR